MTCPFHHDSNGFQSGCSGSCQLKVNGKCAITQIAIQLNTISKKLDDTSKSEK